MAKQYLQLSRTLKRLLFEKDMKPADLARALNIPSPTIHRLVTGKSTRPYESSLKPIADFFSIDVDQLLGEKPLSSENPGEPPSIPSAQSIKTISILSWENVSDFKSSRKESHKQIAVSGNINDDCFALIMNDHSMTPLFPKKTILIFDPNKKPDLNVYKMRLLNENDTIVACLFESRMSHDSEEDNDILEVTT